MLVAVDILGKDHQPTFSRDLIFMSLSGEAHDLIGSRQLLFNLDSPNGPHNGSVAGLRKDDIVAMIEVGMLGHDPNVFNDTADVQPDRRVTPSGGKVFLHHAGNDTLAVNDAFRAAATFAQAPVVRPRASRTATISATCPLRSVRSRPCSCAKPTALRLRR